MRSCQRHRYQEAASITMGKKLPTAGRNKDSVHAGINEVLIFPYGINTAATVCLFYISKVSFNTFQKISHGFNAQFIFSQQSWWQR